MNKQFLQAYDSYADAIFRHCYFRLRDSELAKDITQETFIRTWQYMVNEEAMIKNIRAFLYRVANNLILDEFRKNKPLSLEEEMENGLQPAAVSHPAYDFLDGQSAIAVLQKLPAEYQQVIVMRYIDDLFPDEIAEILQTSANVISVRITRALKKIRNMLPHE